MDIEINYTAAAAAALRKHHISREFSLPPAFGLPAIGDFVEIAAETGRLLFVVRIRAYCFQNGVEQAQRVRLILDLHRDPAPDLAAVPAES